MFKTKLGVISFGVVIGLLLVLVAWQVLAGEYTYQGSLIDPPVAAADFELVDQDGDQYRLSDQRGKVVLIFFGYTHCPDVCPVTLSEFKQIKERLKDQADEVEFVFITVDAERDTVDVLSRYLVNFDPSFIGLTGESQALEEVYRSYGVYKAKQETGSEAGYLVDHTARVYAIDKDGNWRLTYPFGMETEKLYQDVRHLIQEE
jgi:protein SCO1/2